MATPMKRDTEGFSSLVDLLRYRAENQGSRTAFTFLKNGQEEDGTLTFAMLDQKARDIAAHLHKSVPEPKGRTVVLLYPNDLDFITAFFGCLYAGAIPVPAFAPNSRRNNSQRLEAIATNAGAGVVLTTEASMAIMREWISASENLRNIRYLVTDELDETLMSDWVDPSVGTDTLAFLQYTSGSTGAPKGVMVTHGNLLHNVALMKKAYGHDEDSIFVCWVPLYHDLGLIGHVIQTVYLGVPCYLMTPESFLQRPARWLRAISRYKATATMAPNFSFDLCGRYVTEKQIAGLDLSSLDVAAIGAEPIRADTIERFCKKFESYGFRRESFIPTYGLAEATLIVVAAAKQARPTILAVDPEALEAHRVIATNEATKGHRLLVSSGQAGCDHEAIVVDTESGLRCQPNQVGEIWFRGPSIANGYFEREQETKETFHNYTRDTNDGPYLRTGDLGFIQNEEVFFTGRLKDLIIISGENHYPQDIEHTVYVSDPAIRIGCGAAFSVEVEGKERLVVVQEIRRDNLASLDSRSVVAKIRQMVAKHHGLAAYEIVLIEPGTLSKTTSGKIQHQTMKRRYLADELQLIATSNVSKSRAQRGDTTN
jgi:acyl-CoA synthetase (AMP-forming)/AMP-acid ligase II